MKNTELLNGIEVFKSIKGYEGLYEVSNTGKVKSLERYVGAKNGSKRIEYGKMLKQSLNSYGYPKVCLYKNNKRKVVTVHSLVANAFISNPKNKNTVNHIDGNKINNNVSNLEFATLGENLQHAFRTGLNDNVGERNGKAKLTVKDVMLIRELHSTGDYSRKELAEMFNVGYGNINKVINRTLWGHVQKIEQKIKRVTLQYEIEYQD